VVNPKPESLVPLRRRFSPLSPKSTPSSPMLSTAFILIKNTENKNPKSKNLIDKKVLLTSL
jgi:hypothetical protein